MSSIKFLMDFARTGDLKGTLADLKSINAELQKNKGLQKDFGDSFTTSTKSVSTNLDEIAAKTKKAHDALKVTSDAKEIARLTKEIATLRNEYEGLSKTTQDMLIKNQKLQQESAKSTREAIKNENELIKQKKLKNQLSEQERRIAERNAKEKAKLNSIYAQESARLNDLRKKYKDMALSEGTASNEARRLLKEISALDAKLKSVDASVGQFQRNVGNYGSALRGFGSQLATLFGIGGGVMLVRDAFQSFATFQQSLADLSALTGLDAQGKDMQFLKQSSLDLAKTSTASASEVLEAYKLIGSAQPELLKNVTALDKMTKSILVLSEASGLELPEAATAATNVMNQLGLSVNDVDRVINVLAAGAKEGAAEIPDLSAAMLEAGVSMKAANVSIEEGTALIETLAERGIKGSEAGTKLRNVLTKLNAAKALPKEAVDRLEAAGVNMEIISDKTLPFIERLKELNKISGNSAALVKTFGLENQDAAAILIESTERTEELTASVTGTNEAFEQAEKRTGTVGQEFKKLQNTFEALVIEFIDGGGDFAETLKFIRENLETIIKVTYEVIKAVVVFKTTQALVNKTLKEGTLLNIAYTFAMKLMGKETQAANVATKSLNATMSANVIGLVVLGLYELYNALSLIETESDKLANRINNIKKDANIVQGILDANLNKEKQRLDESLANIDKKYSEERRLAEAQGKSVDDIEKKHLEVRTNELAKFRDDQTLKAAKTRQRLFEINQELALAESQEIIDNETRKGIIIDRLANEQIIKKVDDLKAEQMALQNNLKNQLAVRKDVMEQIDMLNTDQRVNNLANLEEMSEDDKKATEKARQEWEKRLQDEKKFLEERLKSNRDYQRKLAELQAGNIQNEEQREIEIERLRNKFAQEDLENHFANENKKIESLSPQSATEVEKRQMIEKNKILETQLILEMEENSENKVTEIRKRFRQEREQQEFNDFIASLEKTLQEEEKQLIYAGKRREEIELRLLMKKKENIQKEIRARMDAGESTVELELELARIRGQIDDTVLNQKLENLHEELKQEELLLLNSKKTEEQIERELLDDKIRLLEEEIRLKKEAGEKTLDNEIELARLKRELRKRDLEELRNFANETIQISFSEVEKKVENNIDGYERQISAQEENIERQRELAEQGLENTLAFEKQVQAENEARLLEEQKRLERIKKIETYYNLLAAYAEEDPNSAPAKALAQMAIAEAIAARFEDGGIVSDEIAKQNGGILKGASHKKGGILIEAEGDEGILSKKEMRNLGKDNFYTLKSALNRPVEPSFMRTQSESMMNIFPQQNISVDLDGLKNEMRAVKSAVENIPVPHFVMDRNGNLITVTETKKFIKRAIQKRKRL